MQRFLVPASLPTLEVGGEHVLQKGIQETSKNQMELYAIDLSCRAWCKLMATSFT